MRWEAVAKEIAGKAERVPALHRRSSWRPISNVSPPYFICGYPIEENERISKGAHGILFEAFVVVRGPAPTDVAASALSDFTDPDGPSSIPAAVQTSQARRVTYDACDTVVVERIEYDVYRFGGVDHPVAIFRTRVTGPGE